MVFFIALIDKEKDCDMQRLFIMSQKKAIGLFKHEKSDRRNFAITVKHAMSKAMNKQFALTFPFWKLSDSKDAFR